MAERHVPDALRRVVASRAAFCYEYCRSQEVFSMDRFSAEHVVPRSRGGETSEDNLALACQGCNGHKYTATTGIDPVTGADVPLFHPRRDVWSEHFAWTADFTHVVGSSPTGRATVERLKLNRVGLVNLRAVLYAAGKHPPSVRGDDREGSPHGD